MQPQRRHTALVAWSLGVVALVLVVIGFALTLAADPAFAAFVESIATRAAREAVRDADLQR